MAHFAKVENGLVTQVIVIDQETLNTGHWGDPQSWIQTSYNTRGGVYYNPITNLPDDDQSKSFRKNFAGIGFKYDVTLDAFIAPKPYPSWFLNEGSCIWDAPVPYPNDGQMYSWDETTKSWVLSTNK